MESKATKTSDLPFYKIARKLLRAKIDSPKKANKFYIDVNNFASEIASDELFLYEISTQKYSDNKSLHDSIIRILGYGKAVEESRIFADSQALQRVNLDSFLNKNDRRKNKIEIIKKEAHLLFKFTEQDFENLQEEVRKLKENQEPAIRVSVEKIIDERSLSKIDQTIDLSPLVYKNRKIYYKDDEIDLPPQSITLC